MLQIIEVLEVGDKVRSYDFERIDGLGKDCYIEGIIEGIVRLPHNSHHSYKLKATKRIFGGKDVTHKMEDYYYPPVNGIKKAFALDEKEYTDFVEKIKQS